MFLEISVYSFRQTYIRPPLLYFTMWSNWPYGRANVAYYASFFEEKGGMWYFGKAGSSFCPFPKE